MLFLRNEIIEKDILINKQCTYHSLQVNVAALKTWLGTTVPMRIETTETTNKEYICEVQKSKSLQPWKDLLGRIVPVRVKKRKP